MASSTMKDCRHCGREVVLSTTDHDLLAFWFHPHTGSVACSAYDVIMSDIEHDYSSGSIRICRAEPAEE